MQIVNNEIRYLGLKAMPKKGSRQNFLPQPKCPRALLSGLFATIHSLFETPTFMLSIQVGVFGNLPKPPVLFPETPSNGARLILTYLRTARDIPKQNLRSRHVLGEMILTR